MARFGSLRFARPRAVRRIVPLAVGVTMVVGLSLTAIAPAQTGSAWHTVGNATLQADRLVLTESLLSRAGAAWQVPAVKLPNRFKARFDFALSQSQGAADGFAYVIQGASVDALGGAGGGLGYTGIPNSIAVEFDTFRNNSLADPAVPHIGIHTRGPQPNDVHEQYSLGVSTAVPFLSNGARHSVIIRYRRHMLSVTLDGQLKLNVPINLRKRLELRRRRVWFGFTAATGASRQRHEILSYRLNRGGEDDEDSPSDDDEDSPSDDDEDSPSDDDEDSPSDDDEDSPSDDDDD